MATFDMTASTTAGVSSDSIAVLPGSRPGTGMRMIESILDISKIRTGPCELLRGHTRACICSSHSGNILLKST